MVWFFIVINLEEEKTKVSDFLILPNILRLKISEKAEL